MILQFFQSKSLLDIPFPEKKVFTLSFNFSPKYICRGVYVTGLVESSISIDVTRT
jgi:hypothetical protein